MFSKDRKERDQYRKMNPFLDPKLEKIFGDSKIEELTGRTIAALIMSGKTFASLNHSKQGVGEIYKIQQTMGLLPELIEKPKKSNEEAQKLRVRGNQAYKAKDPMGALRLYTKAICCAELEGEEIAMAYANRSAVTYWLQEYENSIEDINRALATGKYPTNLTQKLLERRGKCFLALSQYGRASEDFKQVVIRLLQTEIDAEKVNSVKACLDLISECLGKQDVPMKSTIRPPKLTHRPSSYIQSASAAVDIKFSPEMGRHIVASVDIAPGDILAIEKPFSSVLNPDCQDLFCDNCKRRCYSSIPCASCNDVVFCSEFCRETSWTTYHSVECDVLHNLNNLGCKGSGVLAVRSLLRATRLGENLQIFMDDYLNESEVRCKPGKAGFVNNMYLSDHYSTTHNLITHMEHRTPQELLHIAVIASSLVHVLKEASTFFEHSDSSIPSAALFKPVSDLRWNHIVAANLLMRYIMVSACNAHQIDVKKEVKFKLPGDDLIFESRGIGGAIYPFYSLLNHSCDPDVFSCSYNGDTRIVYAVKPITKGQQIFASYRFDYASDDLLTRQRTLRSHFHFTCKCAACLENWPLFDNMPDESPKFVSQRAKNNHGREIAESCCCLPPIFMAVTENEKITEQQFRLLIQHLTLIHKYVQRPWKIYYLCQQAIGHYFSVSYNSNAVEKKSTQPN